MLSCDALKANQKNKLNSECDGKGVEVPVAWAALAVFVWAAVLNGWILGALDQGWLTQAENFIGAKCFSTALRFLDPCMRPASPGCRLREEGLLGGGLGRVVWTFRSRWTRPQPELQAEQGVKKRSTGRGLKIMSTLQSMMPRKQWVDGQGNHRKGAWCAHSTGCGHKKRNNCAMREDSTARMLHLEKQPTA